MGKRLFYGCSLGIIALALILIGLLLGFVFADNPDFFRVAGEEEKQSSPTVVILPPTWTPKPTFTLLVTPPITTSATVSATLVLSSPVPTETVVTVESREVLTEVVQFRVQAEQILLYEGPGSAYPAIAFAEQDAAFPVIGRTSDGQWWQVCCLEEDQPVWLFLNRDVSLESGDANTVPILNEPVLDASPTPLATSLPTLTPETPLPPSPSPSPSLPPSPSPLPSLSPSPSPSPSLSPSSTVEASPDLSNVIDPSPLPTENLVQLVEVTLPTATSISTATSTAIPTPSPTSLPPSVTPTHTSRPAPTATPRPQGNTACLIEGASYGQIDIYGSPSTDFAAADPELNLALRSYSLLVDGFRQLVGLGGDTDLDAPQLNTLFADERIDQDFPVVLRVHEWDWNCNCPGPPITSPEVTLVGISSRPGELLHTPARTNGNIGNSYQAMVLYASPTQLTLKYTREDNILFGYTIHLEGICVDPQLLSLYNELEQAGRQTLPALYGKQPIGYSIGGDIKAAVRDTGRFMDPRSEKDWWAGR